MKDRRIQKKILNRINEQITAREVRLVGDNIKTGIYSISEAIQIADSLSLDLVEINATTAPIICKIMDYEKYIYYKKKNEVKPTKVVVKEIRFRPVTDENDFNIKLKQAGEFLSKGNIVKVSVIFKGREIAYKEQGEIMIYKFIEALLAVGTIEGKPSLEGKRMSITIKPKPKK